MQRWRYSPQTMTVGDAEKRDDAGNHPDGSADAQDAGAPNLSEGGSACEFNDDGILTAAEVPLGVVGPLLLRRNIRGPARPGAAGWTR